jgi:hypothetical protein
MSNFVKKHRDAASSFPDYAAVLQWTFDGLRAWESRRHKKSNDPDGRTNSIASAMTNGGELRNSTTTCLALAGTVASDGSTFDPVNSTAAYPSDPQSCIAMEPESNDLSSFTLHSNCTKTFSAVVEMYVNRIIRDSTFQRLIHSTACSTEEAVFLCMAMLLGLDRACQLAAEQALFSAQVVERVCAALMRKERDCS